MASPCAVLLIPLHGAQKKLRSAVCRLSPWGHSRDWQARLWGGREGRLLHASGGGGLQGTQGGGMPEKAQGKVACTLEKDNTEEKRENNENVIFI